MRPRLVLFGDSITEQSFAPGGWGAALAEHFARQVRPQHLPPPSPVAPPPLRVTSDFC
uniref:SGNH hydrolase-type esterase domain-containing protein n=1 Tax=Aegilops tauschii subsp. strangulata TaxID=200361 RepID=A0A453EEL3_AEGTS